MSEFPKPERRDGKAPCGECHLKDGETCDICGAVAPKAKRLIWITDPADGVLRQATYDPQQ